MPRLHWFLAIVVYPGRLVAAAHAVAGDKVRAPPRAGLGCFQRAAIPVDGPVQASGQ